MADKAHIETDKKLEKMERHLSAIYGQAQKEIGETWTKYMKDSNAEIKDLEDKYNKETDKAEKRKLGKELASAKKEQTLLNKHYKNLTMQTAEQISHVNETATAYINGTLPEVYALNYNELSETVDGVGGYSFELVDADTVKNLATTDKSLLPYREIDTKKDIAWNVKSLNSQVLQGIIQGESMEKIANRLTHVETMNANSAIRNARTMVTGAENKGRQDSFERAEKDGIILGKEWVSTSDDRTRDWHAELDGQTVGVDESFNNEFGDIAFPGDPSADPANVYNCRCSIVGVVRGFRKNEH